MIPFVSVPNYLKYPPEMNLGEILAVAENSKGHLIVLNHPGSATTGRRRTSRLRSSLGQSMSKS